jgi:putative oxidoreductase
MVRRIPYATDTALLIARVAVGTVFTAHGLQKLTEFGHAGTTRSFDAMGVPMPSVAAYYATWVELLGGVALIIGLATSVAGVLLFLDMLGAFVIVHAGNGLFASQGGYELVLALGATALALAVAGAGRISVDNLVLRDTRRPATTAA